MAKKPDPVLTLSPEQQAYRLRRLHDFHRAEVELREENPRDSVYVTPNEDGEVILRRVPDRLVYLDARGHEVLSPLPVAARVDVPRPPAWEVARRRAELLGAWPDANFEDEDNFDIPDDPVDPNTQYEETFEVPDVRSLREAVQKLHAEKLKQQERAANPPPDGPPANPKPPKTGGSTKEPPLPLEED